MANIADPFPYITKRELGSLPDLRSQFFSNRLNAAKNLYRRDLVCHFGCVNAIEFSNNGELLASGGDDRRVMLWQFGKAIMNHGKPEPMKALHQSNIFCLGITTDNQRVFSGGNDDIVIVHDTESKAPLEVLQHQRAVCSLSIDPFNERVVATAGNDGRLLLFDTRQSVHESLVIARSRKAFHGVTFHPRRPGVLASANARDGVALWDLREPKHPAMRYAGNGGTTQNCMSVRFDSTGSRVLALRRRLPPVIYHTHAPEPRAELYHQDYYNSCTMKSCCFATDRFVLSGSDDFNLYVWRAPQLSDNAGDVVVEPPHVVLCGHRSIVNQVRYNPLYCLVASSGVEKIIKVWSPLQYPAMRGALLQEAAGDQPRDLYSHEDYVSLVHHSGQYISHNYAEQSTSEDPRMMAFFDSLVQRELECLGDGSGSRASSSARSSASSSDGEPRADFLPLPPKRPNPNGSRSQRCTNRLARLLASRYSKNGRSQKRGLLRRSKQSRPAAKPSKPPPRAAAGRARSRRAARAPPASSERTDSDEPARCLYRTCVRMLRPVRRRINPTRVAKWKNKSSSFRKSNPRSSGSMLTRDSTENNYSNIDNFEDNLAMPSTSTGYRGQSTSGLFRIAEADSDDEHSASSRPPSPAAPRLVGVVPTPLNGSRDTLGDSLRPEPSAHDGRARAARRRRPRAVPASDSSESPPPECAGAGGERLAAPDYGRTLARLRNETNESELESSCSTEGGPRRAPADLDDPDRTAARFRQRVKKARRSYRTHRDSDSN